MVLEWGEGVSMQKKNGGTFLGMLLTIEAGRALISGLRPSQKRRKDAHKQIKPVSTPGKVSKIVTRAGEPRYHTRANDPLDADD